MICCLQLRTPRPRAPCCHLRRGDNAWRKVRLIANGAEGSATEVRATRIAGALDEFDVDVVCRKGSRLADARRFAAAVPRTDVVYAVDLASAPLLARGVPVVGGEARHRHG